MSLKEIKGKFEGYKDKYDYHVPDGKQKNQRFEVPKVIKKLNLGGKK